MVSVGLRRAGTVSNPRLGGLMDPHGPTAQRFPLVARFRPACLPLPQRVHALVDLADAAVRKADQGLASAVYNQAALIASDLGLPDLARELCHQQAAAYLHSCPLPGMSAIRGLEPVVNLARLQIRAGRADEDDSDCSTCTEPSKQAHMPASTAWRYRRTSRRPKPTAKKSVLGSGAYSSPTAPAPSPPLGRWAEALTHIESHRGVGQRMLDGRQVAVLAALVSGDTASAAELLHDTTPGDPWEQLVTACLTVLCRRDAQQPCDDQRAELIAAYLQRSPEPGMTVFDIRLGLTILDTVGPAETPAAQRIVQDLHRRTAEAGDGYAAREVLAHPLFLALATDREAQGCRALVRACALRAGAIPDHLHGELAAALHTCDKVIWDSLVLR